MCHHNRILYGCGHQKDAVLVHCESHRNDLVDGRARHLDACPHRDTDTTSVYGGPGSLCTLCLLELVRGRDEPERALREISGNVRQQKD